MSAWAMGSVPSLSADALEAAKSASATCRSTRLCQTANSAQRRISINIFDVGAVSVRRTWRKLAIARDTATVLLPRC